MAKLRLSLACWDYDRTRALMDGRVEVDGVDLIYHALPVEETFFRMMRHREFDAAELSLSSYLISTFRDDPFIAIPVFPSRSFRHSCVFVSGRSGIREPKDLIGKRVGVPEYQLTANVWIRGFLADEYGVPAAGVTYLAGGEETPGRIEKIALQLPPEIRIEPIGPTQTLAAMLADGEIDALYAPRKPSTYGSHGVRRLWEDYVPTEREYYQRTGIFPIMHVVAIRREVYEANRWIATALFKAFKAAQMIAYESLQVTAALKTMLPWAVAEEERTRALMGPDFWPYGFAGNEHVLDVFTRYAVDQGLSPRKRDPRELFAPETLEAFTI
ncbi:MAG: ABC transporter substrate-binding protein [Candidatus Elarobacter sp.]